MKDLKRTIVLSIFSVSFTLAVLFVVSVIIFKVMPTPIEEIEKNAPLFIMGKWELKPKSAERTAFLTGIFFFPILSAGTYLYFKKIQRNRDQQISLFTNYFFDYLMEPLVLLATLVFGSLILFYAGIDTGTGIFRIYYPFYFYLAVLALTGYLFYKKRDVFGIKHPLIFILGLGSALVSGLFILLPEKTILSSFYLVHHLEPVLSAVNEAMAGKTAQTDFLSQYGVLYPHGAELFLRIFGLSVWNVNIFFITLIIATWIFIYLAMAERTGYTKAATFILFLSVLGIAHPLFEEYSYNNPYLAPYFQYYPIRSLGGAFFLYFVLKYLSREKNRNALRYIGFFISGLTILWNTDTGVVIFISYLALQIYEILGDKKTEWIFKFKETVKRTVEASVSLFAVLTLFSLFAFLRSGKPPLWMSFFSYQSAYYRLGLSMLPMKPVDLWNIPLFIYFVVLFLCLKHLIDGKTSLTDKYRFYVAVYGTGIFSYYEGRSHILNLFPVTYPALILAGEIVYEFIRDYLTKTGSVKLLNDKIFRFRLLLIMPLLFVLIHGLFNFCFILPGAYAGFLANFQRTDFIPGEKIVRSSEIVRNKKNSDGVIIISDFAAFMHINTGTHSLLPYPPESVALKSEADGIKKTILTTDGPVFMDPEFNLSNYLLKDPEITKVKNRIYLLP